jgi:hypothetical protein
MQKGSLGFVGGAGLYGRKLQGFSGSGKVLPAIQYSKNRA